MAECAQLVFGSGFMLVVAGAGLRVWHADEVGLGGATDVGGFGGASGHGSSLPAAVIPAEDAASDERLALLYGRPSVSTVHAGGVRKRKAAAAAMTAVGAAAADEDDEPVKPGRAGKQAPKTPKAKALPVSTPSAPKAQQLDDDDDDDDDEDEDDQPLVKPGRVGKKAKIA